MAVCQSRDPGPAQDYYLKKTAEGKTPREARRALERRLSIVLYRRILHDHHQAEKTAALTHRGAIAPRSTFSHRI